MNSIDPRIKNYIIGGIILAIALLLYFGVLVQYQEFNTQKQSLKRYSQELDENRTAKDKLGQYLKQYDKLKTESGKVSKALPLKSEDMPQLLNLLQNLTGSAGLVLGDLSFDNQSETVALRKDNVLYYQTINIAVSGSFAGLENFILNAENSLRVMDILKIDMGHDEGGDTNTYEIKLRVYYQK
jgi:Tfp pilus assembly protein PilO